MRIEGRMPVRLDFMTAARKQIMKLGGFAVVHDDELSADNVAEQLIESIGNVSPNNVGSNSRDMRLLKLILKLVDFRDAVADVVHVIHRCCLGRNPIEEDLEG